MAEFKMKCPHCGAECEVDEEWIGMEVECPTCKQMFTIAKAQNQGNPVSSYENKLMTYFKTMIGTLVVSGVCASIAIFARCSVQQATFLFYPCFAFILVWGALTYFLLKSIPQECVTIPPLLALILCIVPIWDIFQFMWITMTLSNKLRLKNDFLSAVHCLVTFFAGFFLYGTMIDNLNRETFHIDRGLDVVLGILSLLWIILLIVTYRQFVNAASKQDVSRQ